MKYEFTVEEVSSSRQKLHFTVSKSEVSEALDKTYAEWKSKARLPGFRKGKVPRFVLEKKFSRNIEAEVAQGLVDQAYRDLDHDSLKIVSQPNLEDMGAVTAKSDFSFTLGVDVQPTVEVADYKGMNVVYPTVEVSDADFDARIASMLESKRRIQSVEDASATVAEDDFALVDLTLSKEGEDDITDGTMVHIGQHKFYTGIDQHLVGMKTGETREFELTITEDSLREELRGQSYAATVLLKEIQRYVTPELNDEMAAELGYESASDLNEKVRTEMFNSLDLNLKNNARIEILQNLVANHQFDVPNGMVDIQLRALMEELAMQRMYAGEDPRKIRFSDQQIADLRNRASFAAKAACILASISEKEGLDVTQDDIDAKMQEMAEMRGQTIEAIKAYIASENADETLRERVQEEKTLNWLLDQANRVDAPEPSVESSVEKTEEVVEEKTSEVKSEAELKKMKKDEIFAYATENGFDVKKSWKKADMIAAILG